MKTRSVSPMGSLHPILFFAALYVVALLFFIFICSSLFYSCNAQSSARAVEKTGRMEKPVSPAGTVALR